MLREPLPQSSNLPLKLNWFLYSQIIWNEFYIFNFEINFISGKWRSGSGHNHFRPDRRIRSSKVWFYTYFAMDVIPRYLPTDSKPSDSFTSERDHPFPAPFVQRSVSRSFASPLWRATLLPSSTKDSQRIFWTFFIWYFLWWKLLTQKLF